MMNGNLKTLLEKKLNSQGVFSASVNGVAFLESEIVMYLHTNMDDWIIGMDRDGNNSGNNWVAFSVPSTLVGDGPHNVKHYQEPWNLKWEARIAGTYYDVTSGSATFTYKNNRKSVTGTIDFLMKDGRKVTGSFDIWND